jgi:tetratricopeptide (TPR) repeat protein
VVYLAQKLRLLQYRGHFDAQLPLLEQLSKLPFGSDIGVALTRVMIGEEHALAGRVQQARAYYDPETTSRLLRLGDDSIQLAIARLAVAADDVDIAERLHRRMTVNRDRMVNGGVFLMVLEGPTTWGLAWLCQLLGRFEEASTDFAHALEVARRSGGKPVAALIALDYARHLSEAGDAESIRRAVDLARLALETAVEVGMSAAQADAESVLESLSSPVLEDPRQTPSLSMTQTGDTWLVTFGNVEFHVKNVRGVRMLATLVAEPNREFHVIDLSGTPSSDSERVDLGDSGPAIDEEARRQYRARVAELRGELEEAEEWNDTARAERAREELDAIEAELSRAVGLGGRHRRRGSAAERARVNVQRRIRDAIRRIEAFHPGLAKHLDRSVRTGTFCSYEP